MYVTGGRLTREVAPALQTDLWREHVTDNQGRIDFGFATADSFAGGTRVQRCGGLQLVEFWSDPVAYIRRPNAADRDGDDSLRLVLPLAGDLRVSGRVLSPGFAAAVSMDSGFCVEHERQARAFALTLPSRLWEGGLPREPMVWDLGAGTGAVFGAMLHEIHAQRGNLDAGSFVRACESAAVLLDGRSGLGDNLLEQARAIVRQFADDVAFDPAALAGKLGWSLRSVQQALRRAGTTPAELIRRQRLERVVSRFRSPAWETRSISHIAHASGFGSLTAFNTAFRMHYGCSPSDLRRTAPPTV